MLGWPRVEKRLREYLRRTVRGRQRRRYVAAFISAVRRESRANSSIHVALLLFLFPLLTVTYCFERHAEARAVRNRFDEASAASSRLQEQLVRFETLLTLSDELSSIKSSLDNAKDSRERLEQIRSRMAAAGTVLDTDGNRRKRLNQIQAKAAAFEADPSAVSSF